MAAIIVLACILILSMPAIGIYTFFASCRRMKERNWFDPAALKKAKREHLIPMVENADAWLKAHTVQDVYMHTFDGLKLYARWIPAENPRGTIVLAHGYRSTPYVDFSLVMDVYHSLGINMLIPDQRSHGKSEGKYITFGVKEWKDMRAWVSFHNAQLGQWPVILSGLSMGAATVMYAADEQLPVNVRGIIADCGFTSPYEIIAKVFKTTAHLPPRPFVWLADRFARLFAGFSFKEKDSRVTLRAGKLPVLLAHGLADTFVPCEMSVQAYEACSSEKELLLVKDAGHGYSFLKDRERYTKAVMDFLKKNL